MLHTYIYNYISNTMAVSQVFCALKVAKGRTKATNLQMSKPGQRYGVPTRNTQRS